MAKTVNSSLVFTRDGFTTTQNLPALPYERLVALQIAVAAVMVQLAALGSTRVADMSSGSTRPTPGGDVDVSYSMTTDHGAGGSTFAVGYSGISKEIADAIDGAFMTALQGALPQTAVASAA